jgi:hypothetical protein
MHCQASARTSISRGEKVMAPLLLSFDMIVPVVVMVEDVLC